MTHPTTAAGSPASPPARRRPWRVSVRGLMVLVLVVGGPLGWMARRASIQRRAVAAIKSAGGSVTYDDQITMSPEGRRTYHQGATPAIPAWIRRAVGDEPFREVAEVGLGSLGGPLPSVPASTLDSVLNFGQLRGLSVHRVPWDNAQLARLKALKHLRVLSLQGTAATGTILATLRTMPDLAEIVLRTEDGALRGDDLRPLAGMTQLRHLFLIGFHDLRAADLGPLRNLPRLESLRLSTSPVDDGFLAELRGLDRLQQLTLAQTRVSDASLIQLARLPRLWSLRVDGANITDAGMRAIGSMRSMLYLELDSDQPGRFTDAGLAHLGNLADLRSLTINAGSVSVGALTRLLQALPNLPMLSLSGLQPEHKPLLPILVGRSATATLNLAGPGVTDAWVPMLIALPAPAHFRLDRTAITDLGAAQLAAHPTLTSLTLDETGLTDAGLLALARAPRLGFLSVRGTRVTEAGIAAFRAARPKVGLATGPALPPSTRPPLSGYP